MRVCPHPPSRPEARSRLPESRLSETLRQARSLPRSPQVGASLGDSGARAGGPGRTQRAGPAGLQSRGRCAGSGRSTYRHPDRRGWWQREASPLRAEVSAGTPRRHHGSQGATEEGRPLRQKQQQTRTPQGPPQALVSPNPSNGGGGSASRGDGGGHSEAARKAPRVEPFGNLGDRSAACPEPAQILPHQNKLGQRAPSTRFLFGLFTQESSSNAGLPVFALAASLRETGSSRRAEAD